MLPRSSFCLRTRTATLASVAAGAAVTVLLGGTAPAAMVTGRVVGDGARPIDGAVVQVVRPTGEAACEALTAADGSFTLDCDVEGRHSVRADFGDLAPWQIDDVELAPERTVHLNFLLRSAVPAAAVHPEAVVFDSDLHVLARPLANSIVATWGDREITRRIAGIVLAVVGFILGAACILWVGRHLQTQRRRLTEAEVADHVINARRRIGRRLTTVGAGARGAEAGVSYSAEDIATLMAARRYGALVMCVLSPVLFAIAAFGFGLALLVDQPLYLFILLLLVPAGFIGTTVVIFVQARTTLRDRRRVDGAAS